MSAPSSVEELLQLIRKSGMVDEQKLGGYLQRREAGRGLPSDPREAADAMVQDGLITGFQAEQFLLGKWRGFTIGKYKLLERIGVGGMGQVFLSEHSFMKRRVAIKVLPPAKAEQPAALGRFYREARAAGSIEHPNIVRTHDIDQDGNLHFIVMEYVDGSNLLDITKKFSPLDIRRVCSYIKQVAEGLDYAFRNGIIHRDIKPGNILVDRTGHAKLLDMGLARFYNDHSDNLTVKYDDKIVLGTADYVAPEQVANSHNVDIRADIYALGASFYFMLAGHPPFPTGTVSQKLLWHRTKDPTPIRQIRADVPEGIAQIVAKMMQKEPSLRFQTPGEVAAALTPWVPDQVPLPAEEEMPVLSPAAMEGAEASDQAELVQAPEPPVSASVQKLRQTATALGAIAAPPVSEIRAKSQAGKAPSPFAPVAVATETPEPQAVSVGASGRRSAATVSLPPPQRGKDRPLPPSPFASTQAEVPTAHAAPDPTPSGYGPVGNARGPAYQPGKNTFPVIAMPPRDDQSNTRKYIFFGLIGASAVLALSLILGKFVFGGGPKPAPAPVPQVKGQE